MTSAGSSTRINRKLASLGQTLVTKFREPLSFVNNLCDRIACKFKLIPLQRILDTLDYRRCKRVGRLHGAEHLNHGRGASYSTATRSCETKRFG
jgi:hypothetical protein